MTEWQSQGECRWPEDPTREAGLSGWKLSVESNQIPAANRVYRMMTSRKELETRQAPVYQGKLRMAPPKGPCQPGRGRRWRVQSPGQKTEALGAADPAKEYRRSRTSVKPPCQRRTGSSYCCTYEQDYTKIVDYENSTMKSIEKALRPSLDMGH